MHKVLWEHLPAAGGQGVLLAEDEGFQGGGSMTSRQE